MIGNDIVDLHYAYQQSNWQRDRFLDKIFTQEEQCLIAKTSNKFEKVWLLWSMKESAYKAYVQKYPNRFFNPKMLQCKLFTSCKGQVSIKGEQFGTQTKRNKKVIHTIAFSQEENRQPISEYFDLANSSYPLQQTETRRKFKLNAEKVLNIPAESLHIVKSKAGIPQLFTNGNSLNLSFSLTHHGRFGAYCILES